MKHTNTPPVYLLCFGELGRLVEAAMPARIKQELHIIKFPSIADVARQDRDILKPDWLPIVTEHPGKHNTSIKYGESLMRRLLFSRKQPLIISIVNPSNHHAAKQAEDNLRVLERAKLTVIGLFLNDGMGMYEHPPSALTASCLGYTQLRLEGHAEDHQAYKRVAAACIRQVELLFHLTTYPDSEPSFLRMLPLLLKDCPQFVLASGFAEGNLSTAGERLSSKLSTSLQKPVRGRSLVMVLTKKRHMGFHEISIVNNTCATLLGNRMVIKAGGSGHPHLRTGQYLLIGMVSARKVHSHG